jgi:cobalamin-dependent methionine synthase I
MSRRGTQRQTLGKVVLCTVEETSTISENPGRYDALRQRLRSIRSGVNVPIDRLVATAAEVGADIVGVSALLTTTMVKQKTVVEKLKELWSIPPGESHGRRGAGNLRLGRPDRRSWL